jgi:hypothetical protein
MNNLFHAVGLCLVFSIKNVILHIKYITCTLEHHSDVFQYFDIKYCWLLSSSTLTLVVVSQGNQIIRYLDIFIPVKNTGDRSAFVVCEGEFIPVFETEFSDVFCLARIAHKFNSRIIIN